MSLLLIDSASLWYRAYYGMPDTLLSPKGEPINAIKGFIDMSARLINHYKPQQVVLCLDGDWRPSWRVELFPGYKLNRIDAEGEEEEPDLLTPQIPYILDFFDALGFPVIGVDDAEADDVIATIASRTKGSVRIATGDRDLFQLVDDDKDIKVVYLAKGISAHDLVDRSWIEKKYGIPGDRYSLFAMIRGDVSDGLPGIKGIGEKGAAAIAMQFASMNEVIEATLSGDQRLKDAHRKKISADIDYARIVQRLVSCTADLRLPNFPEKHPSSPANIKEVNRIREELGLGSSVDRLFAALSWQK